ncbi:MAG TPA: MFS transporter [Thermomicrobiales bacterium]|nr:MFS transporter [Thermomicrobiales bacterium]
MRRSELVLAVYLPTALLAMGQGLLLATLPFYAKDLGASLTMISVITAAAAIGTLVADVPVGIVLHRIGLRRTMLLGSALVVLGTMSLALPLEPVTVVAFRLLAGVGTAMWGLSRHAFITQATDSANRGRSIAVFGGINRIGTFAGPAVGGIIATAASTSASFLLAGVMGSFAFLAAVLFIPRDGVAGANIVHSRHVRWGLVRDTIRTNGGDLTAAAVAQLFAQMIRQGRQLLIPLVGATTLGLNPAQVGLIMTASAVLDMTMFIPAGFLMDRYGRKFAAVPSFAIMAIGIGMVPFATGFNGLLIAGLVIGLGNGLGSGTMMTLGADLAPPGATGEFLGIWRLIGDTGMVMGPLAVGLIATWIGLDGSAIVLMIAGFLSSAILFFLVKETREVPVVHTVGPQGQAGA